MYRTYKIRPGDGVAIISRGNPLQDTHEGLVPVVIEQKAGRVLGRRKSGWFNATHPCQWKQCQIQDQPLTNRLSQIATDREASKQTFEE